MFSTLFYGLTIWTVVSLSVGVTWVTLCFAYDGFAYMKRSRRRNEVGLPLANAVVSTGP